jgi:predicted NBD/HSP70 family sugar kinase
VIRLFSEIPDVKVTERLLYKIIHQHGPLTKNTLLHHVPSSLPTVSRLVDSLEKKGLVQISNKETAGGRNPAEYVINPAAGYAFGAYIGSEAYGIGVCDIAGQIHEKVTCLFQNSTTPSHVVEFFAEFIERVVAQHQIDIEHIAGIGVAGLGPILKQKGIIYHPHHLTLSGWETVPIKDLIEMRTKYPTWLDSITEVALLGELVYGPHKEYTNAAYLWLDRGIGSAIYSKGVLGIGNEDFSSGVGHTVIDFQGKPCVCGKRGCLETYASMDAIVEAMQLLKPELLQIDTMPCEESIWHCSPEIEAIARYQASDDPQLKTYFETLRQALTAAISNFLHLSRPTTLFLAGRTVRYFPALIDQVLDHLQQEYDHSLAKSLQFITSDLTDELLIQGASFLVFNNYIHYF